MYFQVNTILCACSMLRSIYLHLTTPSSHLPTTPVRYAPLPSHYTPIYQYTYTPSELLIFRLFMYIQRASTSHSPPQLLQMRNLGSYATVERIRGRLVGRYIRRRRRRRRRRRFVIENEAGEVKDVGTGKADEGLLFCFVEKRSAIEN